MHHSKIIIFIIAQLFFPTCFVMNLSYTKPRLKHCFRGPLWAIQFYADQTLRSTELPITLEQKRCCSEMDSSHVPLDTMLDAQISAP